MRMPLASRILFSISGIFLPVGAHVADYSPTHIFNPNWPPHAKFHDGQTLLFSIFLGILIIFFAFRRTQDKTLLVLATASLSAIYWITQGLAILYPGTAFLDPEFDNPAHRLPLNIPGQLIPQVIFLAVTIVAAYLALRKKARWT